ncbi:cytosine deaminase [Pseudoneurospora amorphoporcata]|uniref:Cytosine deaminase n=1 Tax=Pseudoneurospora amorphoporcata TaxID=241081 RepID=A0AAN6NW14_9PEZI|nr:cytosine deaminase [Pseudoneurospora amorphoporcata]
MNDAAGLAIAFKEAKKSYEEGGIPVSRGHNQRVQLGETATLLNAGRLPASTPPPTQTQPCTPPSRPATCVRELFCFARFLGWWLGRTGPLNQKKGGGEDYLRQRGVEVVVVDDEGCKELMERFIRVKPDVWWEDIGEEGEKDKVEA